jgi:hypothetical protein
MGEIVDLQKWKENRKKKTLDKQVFNVLDNLFSVTPCPGGVELKYFITEGQVIDPFIFFEYTCE